MNRPIEFERARRRAKHRRYGRAHRAIRKAIAPVVLSGNVVCHFCRKPIRRGEPFDLDHSVDGMTWRGATHARCNRRDGALRSSMAGPGPSRDWFG